MEGRTFLWAGIAVLAILAAGFLILTTILFRSAYREPVTTEAKDVLTALYEAEMSRFSARHCFSDDPEAIVREMPEARRYEWAIVSADCDSFIARAWANLDDDPSLDVWEITDADAFRPLHVFDDEKDIGYPIDPLSTNRWRPENGYFQPPVGDNR
jgi:hypothetical protein